MLSQVGINRSRMIRPFLIGSMIALAGCASGASKESVERQAAIEIDKCLGQIGFYETPNLNGRLISMDVAISREGSIQTIRLINQDDFVDEPELLNTINTVTQQAIADCDPADLPPDRYDVWKSVVFEVKLD